MAIWTTYAYDVPVWSTHASKGERANDGVIRFDGTGKMGHPIVRIPMVGSSFTKRPKISIGDPFKGASGHFVNVTLTKTQHCRVKMIVAYLTEKDFTIYPISRKIEGPNWENFSRPWLPNTPQSDGFVPPNKRFQDNIGSNFPDIEWNKDYKWEWEKRDGMWFLVDRANPLLVPAITRPAAVRVDGKIRSPGPGYRWETYPGSTWRTVAVSDPFGKVELDSWENRATLDHVIIGHILASSG